MDADEALGEMIRALNTSAGDGIEAALAAANSAAPTDEHFRYALELRDRGGVVTSPTGAVRLVVDARADVAGDSIRVLGNGSAFEAALDRLSPDDVWLDFAVDEASIDLFRVARAMAAERGFRTAWAPMQVDLPMRYAVTARGTAGSVPLGTRAKPER